MKFNGIELTESSVQACRQWFHDNALAIIQESNERFSDDPERAASNAKFWGDSARNALTIGKDGGERVSVAFLQRAYFIQTGESVALLP